MFVTQTIESTQNNAFKQALKWVKSTPVKNRSQHIAWCEGLHLAVELCKNADSTILQVWMPVDLFKHSDFHQLQQLLNQLNNTQANKLQLFELPHRLYAKLSEQKQPVGPLIFFTPPMPETATEHLQNDWVILDAIQDPGNLGTILRTCAAANIKNIGLTKGCAWPWGNKALRAGMGAQWQLRFIEESDFPDQFHQPIYTTLLTENSQPLYKLDLKKPTVWVFGNEGQGVSETWQHKANEFVRIPQSEHVESLNVASSAAIILFEQLRQRMV